MTTPTQNLPYLFKSPTPNWVYIFPNGKRLIFSKGIATTSDPKEVAHLNLEIELGHPQIFVDPNEVQVSLDRVDPIAALKGRLRMELLAEIAQEMAAATNPGNDMGKSEQGKFKPASTSDMLAVTANGDAAARMAALRAATAKVESSQVVQTPGKPLEIPQVKSEE